MSCPAPGRPVVVLGATFDEALLRPFTFPRGCVMRISGFTNIPIVIQVWAKDTRPRPIGASPERRLALASAYARAVGVSGSVTSICSWLEFVELATQLPADIAFQTSAVVVEALPFYDLVVQRPRWETTVRVDGFAAGAKVSVSREAPSSSFDDACAAAKAALVQMRLLDERATLLESFAIGGIYYTDEAGVLVNKARVPIGPLDVLVRGRPCSSRRLRLLPHHVCVACHAPLLRAFAASQRIEGVPYFVACRNCPAIRQSGLMSWGFPRRPLWPSRPDGARGSALNRGARG